MSIIDKAIAAITPPESEEARHEATQKARSAARPGDWLSQALDHHEQIRMALNECRQASGQNRLMALKRLALVLNGHSLAEEIVLYPALSDAHETGHANMAYTEQTATKMQMAALEKMDPDTKDWDDKLEHIRGALLHHMYQEEGNWFLDLKEQAPEQDEMLSMRFREEFERYVGSDDPMRGSSSSKPMSGVEHPAGQGAGAAGLGAVTDTSSMGGGMSGGSTSAL